MYTVVCEAVILALGCACPGEKALHIAYWPQPSLDEQLCSLALLGIAEWSLA